MFRVIVLDNIAPEGLQLLKEADGISFEVRTGLKGQALCDALGEFDGAICRSGVKITSESLSGQPRLRAIVRAGVGTDNIDKTAATRRGIVVMNTPTGNTLSTAEHAFALMLALSRNIAPAHQSLREGRWDRKAYMGSQLADKTLGVVGLGRIGQEVAARARAFQMRVLGYDPFLATQRAEELGVELIESVHDMLPRIDYLTVHTPLTPETRGLIGAAEIEMLRPGARLVNCARGGIYDEQALADGLRNGKLGGVALDVYEQEPCTDSPLFQMPGVLCTPHLGASTEEAQTQVAVEAVHLLLNFLQRGEIRHAVNTASIDPKALAGLKGFLNLSYRLGRLMAQWPCGSVARCRLQYKGEVAGKNTRMLTAAFCAGLLENALAEEVNIINAEMLLKERGIELEEETTSEMSAFSSSITASVTTAGGESTTAGGEFTAAGVLFGNDMVRLIRLQEFRLEAYLDGILLTFTHNDVPGIIGRVGAVFGKHQVNIAQMSVGREANKPGGKAIGILNLDSRPSPEALDELLAQPDILSVGVVDLPLAGKQPSWLE